MFSEAVTYENEKRYFLLQFSQYFLKHENDSSF